MSNYANDITLHALGYKLEEGRDKEYISFWFWLSYIIVWKKLYWSKCFMYLAKDGKNGTFIFNYFILITTMKWKCFGLLLTTSLFLKVTVKNRGSIKIIKPSKSFPEKINFQFHNKVTV